jgi:hypothetical protein
MELKLCSRNCFFVCFIFSFKVIVTLTFAPKINRGLLPNMYNHPMKFEYCGPMELKLCFVNQIANGWTNARGIT